MSLTSYRAAPPRVNLDGRSREARGRKQKRGAEAPLKNEEGFVLGRPGNDLLSRVLRHSTISAEEFNGRVRDGIGFGLLAQVTGPAKDNGASEASILGLDPRTWIRSHGKSKRGGDPG